jgi:LmbE family N-acetylglucosaminyl deacetylase
MNNDLEILHRVPTPAANARSSIGMEMLDRLCAPPGDPLPAPRTLLVLAHPDDETVGASSRLPRINPAAFVYVTNGAPDTGSAPHTTDDVSCAEYAWLRRAEARRALAHVGVSSERAVFLDYPHRRAAYQLVPLTVDLRRWILATRPEVVLTHSYEGGHPDHDAVAFAVHAAVLALIHEQRDVPVVIEFTSYHGSGDNWVFSQFLPAPDGVECTISLTPDMQALKQRLLGCYHSQALALDAVPLEQERFRLAPVYDFTRPPHPGTVLYERYSWGMKVREWCALASAATERLQNASLAATA